MNDFDFDASLRDKIGALQKDKQPERDLWPGIELALANEAAPNQQTLAGDKSPHQNTKWMAMAAAFAFVGVLSWYGINQPADNITGDQLIAALSNQHEEQKDALLVKFQGQPALTENWQEQLTELDQAAAAIKAALREEPNNVALLKMLQNVHQQQINLIERVHSPKWRQI